MGNVSCAKSNHEKKLQNNVILAVGLLGIIGICNLIIGSGELRNPIYSAFSVGIGFVISMIPKKKKKFAYKKF